jgi:hypothetical protein
LPKSSSANILLITGVVRTIDRPFVSLVSSEAVIAHTSLDKATYDAIPRNGAVIMTL